MVLLLHLIAMYLKKNPHTQAIAPQMKFTLISRENHVTVLIQNLCDWWYRRDLHLDITWTFTHNCLCIDVISSVGARILFYDGIMISNILNLQWRIS